MRLLPTALSLSFALSLLVSCSPSNSVAPEAPSKAPDEAAAILALKNINEAQANFIRRTRRYAQTTDELIANHLLNAEPTAEGYSILMLPSADAVRYTAKATPGTPGARHFFTDQTGTVRAESGKAATVESPAI
jgi:hypothetical protein